MSVDYIVASLPALAFGTPPSLTWERFADICSAVGGVPESEDWRDHESLLRNAVAEARGGSAFARPVRGVSPFWRNRILACFQETDVLKRDELIDRVFWDAAAERTPPTDPLGRGALETYAIRLRIALRRARLSRDAGNEVFDRMTDAAHAAQRLQDSTLSIHPTKAL